MKQREDSESNPPNDLIVRFVWESIIEHKWANDSENPEAD